MLTCCLVFLEWPVQAKQKAQQMEQQKKEEPRQKQKAVTAPSILLWRYPNPIDERASASANFRDVAIPRKERSEWARMDWWRIRRRFLVITIDSLRATGPSAFWYRWPVRKGLIFLEKVLRNKQKVSSHLFFFCFLSSYESSHETFVRSGDASGTISG